MGPADTLSQARSEQPRTFRDLVDPQLLVELRRIELRTRRSISNDLMGGYRSAFRGTGLIFSDLREYQAGDEVKRIHWKASVRTGKTFVKSYEEDRQLNILLLLDSSNSTNFGAPRTRQRRSLEFAALLALLAKQNNDSVGLGLFTDQIEVFLPLKKSRNAFQRVLLELLQPRPLKRATDLSQALNYVRQHQRRPAVIFIISDFYTKAFEDELRALCFRHDVICVLNDEHWEDELPDVGLVTLRDAESQQFYELDSSSASVRTALSAFNAARIANLRALCKRTGADLMTLGSNPLQALADLMRRRTARLR